MRDYALEIVARSEHLSVTPRNGIGAQRARRSSALRILAMSLLVTAAGCGADDAGSSDAVSTNPAAKVVSAPASLGCGLLPILCTPTPTPTPTPTSAAIELTPTPCCDGVFAEGTAGDGKQHVWQTSTSAPYLYFKIPASLKAVAGQPLYVSVQYYDSGYNRLTYQYDNGANAFASPEVTTHSSLTNAKVFSTGYFEMKTPSLQARENGGNDFRVSTSSGPVSIAHVLIKTTPFDDPAFKLAMTTPWLTGYPNATADTSTLDGKTVAGYQGWFGCPNDLNDQGWTHWSYTAQFTVEAGFPTWPDVSAYPATSSYSGARCKADQVVTRSGKAAFVYSSSNPDVVAQHFAWMKQYDIDGVFLQRFLGGGNVPGAHPEWVLADVRKSASQNGRIWAIEYDVSELNNANVVETVEADWKWLNDAAHVRGDGNYSHSKGKPVVVIWGLACRPGFTPDTADTLVDFFKNDAKYGGNYVLGGICNQYRNMAGWEEHFRRYDGLQVWQPQDNAGDKALFTSAGIDWYPHIWAGHSAAGQEYWGNTYNAVAAGPKGYFIGMFDEYGENTAIIPISDDPPTGTPAMLTNQGKPLTWWMQLSAYGKKMMLKQIPLTQTMPTP